MSVILKLHRIFRRLCVRLNPLLPLVEAIHRLEDAVAEHGALTVQPCYRSFKAYPPKASEDGVNLSCSLGRFHDGECATYFDNVLYHPVKKKHSCDHCGSTTRPTKLIGAWFCRVCFVAKHPEMEDEGCFWDRVRS